MKILSKDLFFSILKNKDLMATFTVNVISPSDTTVTIMADGYTQIGNSIEVPIGTEVRWRVEKSGYVTAEDTKVIIGNSVINTRLSDAPMCTVTVRTVPEDAKVSIISSDGIWSNGQEGKGIVVPIGTDLNISVFDPELNSYKTSIYAQEDKEIDVILTNTITIAPTPEDASVKINGVEGTTKTQPCNAVVDWEVSKEGYVTQSDTIVLNERGFVPNRIASEFGDNRIKVELNKKTYAVEFTVASPADAKISAFIENGESVEGDGRIVINGYFGDVIKWTASKDGYVPMSGEFVISETNIPDIITLDVKKYLVTVAPMPESCYVTIKSGDIVLKAGNGTQRVNVEKDTNLSYIVQYGTVVRNGTVTVAEQDVYISVPLPVESLNITSYNLPVDVSDRSKIFSVLASDNNVILSYEGSDSNKLMLYALGSGSAQKIKDESLGKITSFSSFDTSVSSMVYFAPDAVNDKAFQLSVNPNDCSIKTTASRTFSSADTWGSESIVNTTQGWLGKSLLSSGRASIYLNNNLKYSFQDVSSSSSIAGVLPKPRTRISKINDSYALGRVYNSSSTSWDLATFTSSGYNVIYYNIKVTDTFYDYLGYYICTGADGFIVFNTSFNKVYSYAATSGRKFYLLGRINNFYYVVDAPASKDSSVVKSAKLLIFNSSSWGQVQTVDLPGTWYMTTNVEVCRTIPCVSQTGYLTYVYANSSASNALELVRIQGY